MKKLVLACGILVSVVSVSLGAMSQEEWDRARHNCIENKDKNACQALIDNEWVSVEQCNVSNCTRMGTLYVRAGRYRESIPYLEKAITLGDDRAYGLLGMAYGNLQDYYNAKKYDEIMCNKGLGNFISNHFLILNGYSEENILHYMLLAQAESCVRLGKMYNLGEGVRQDYHKAAELLKKACDMNLSDGCFFLGYLYYEGKGVRKNLYTAKQYYGKSCDLGNQMGCFLYEKHNKVEH